MTMLEAVSMTETLLLPVLVTYKRVPVGSRAIPSGATPTGIVVSMALAGVSITETVRLTIFVTYTRVLEAMTPKPSAPIGIVAMTALVVVSMTETSLLIRFAT